MRQPTVPKRALALLLFLLALILFLVGASRALSPYENGTGVCWRQFRAEKRDSVDVLFFGSSYQFCDVSPAAIYAETGLTSYVVGGPAQSPATTFFYLREALVTQSPRAVVVDLNCLSYAPHTNYPEINIGMMPYSLNRVAAALTCAPREARAGLLFPLYSYHGNWNQLSLSDMWKRLTDRSLDLSAGYCLYRGENPDGAWSEGAFDTTSPAFAENLRRLDRMARLCERRGIRLYFVVNPLTATVGKTDFTHLADALTAVGGAWSLVNGGACRERVGLNPKADYFDASHMNASGAEKYSAFLGGMLLADLGSPTDPAIYDAALWERRVRWFADSPEGAATAYYPD